MLIEEKLSKYIDLLASDSSMPGGGSAAALVSAMGAGLVEMGMHFTMDKESFKNLDEDIKKELLTKIERVAELRLEQKKLIDEDTEAFNEVLKAFKLSKDTEEERKLRREKILEGYKKALSVPLQCYRLSLELLRLQLLFVKYINKGLITDIGIGSIFAYSALESSELNILINLKEIRDNEYKEKILKELETSKEEAINLKREILGIVENRI